MPVRKPGHCLRGPGWSIVSKAVEALFALRESQVIPGGLQALPGLAAVAEQGLQQTPVEMQGWR